MTTSIFLQPLGTGNSLSHVTKEAGPVPAVREQLAEASQAWLVKSPSRDTRSNYELCSC